MRRNLMYDFNKQKTFRVGYIAGNNKSNQEYKGHNKKNMVQKGLLLAKGKWDKNLHLIFLQ